MMKSLRFASAFGLVSLVLAQNTSIISVFLYGADQQSLVASVLGADSSATSYLLNCPSGTDSNNCGIFSATLTTGPGFVGYDESADGSTMTVSCQTSGTTSASCFGSVGGPTAVTTTTHTQLGSTDITMLPVTITAGLDKLKAGATASAGAAGSSPTVFILYPTIDPKQLALSVVTAGPLTTVYEVGCATGANANDSCPYGPNINSVLGVPNPWMTMAPNFFGWNYTFTIEPAPTETLTETVARSCKVSSTSSGACVDMFMGEFGGSTFTTSSSTNLVLDYGAATVTAGAEKLASATAPAAASSSSHGAAARETAGFAGGLMAVAAVGVGLLV